MNSFNQVWDSVCAQLQKVISATAFELWFKPLKFIKFEGDTIHLSIGEAFKKNIIETKFRDKFDEATSEVFGFPVNFVIYVEGQEPTEKPVNTVTPNSIKERYTFENFVQGPTNSFAYSAALNVAENPGKNYNPLFIYGPSGVGKTHLMNAIMNKIKDNNPSAVIYYFTGEHFMNEFIACIRNETNYSFREKYRNADVLLVDDIQSIVGKVQTQEEFFHTFNTLKDNGKQVVFTSDVAPRLLEGLPDRLLSRFEEGILADIAAPELETRVAIVKRKADDLQLKLDDSMALYIAENVKKNVRQLEGIVKKIESYSNLIEGPISIGIVKGFIDEVTPEKLPVEDQVNNVINEVARVYGITAEEIKSNRRSSPVVAPRQVAMYIINKTTSLTQTEIGSYFSGRDHATVIYAIKSITAKMEADRTLKATVDEIIRNLNS